MKIIKQIKQKNEAGYLDSYELGAHADAVFFADGQSLQQKAGGSGTGGAVLSGTSAPAASLGNDGDIYVQY